MWRLILFVGMMISTAISAEENELCYKQRGIKCFHSNELDSALFFFNRALVENAADGEVLGKMALTYTLKGDDKNALLYAKKARKQDESTCTDAYLAGILVNEDKGLLLKRDKWLRQGLKQFPDDYLLLYHGGRIKVYHDSHEGERFLLHSIYANPSFEEAHLLLGESMYRRGENLKAVLPLYYFLLLENDTGRSSEVITMLEYLFDAWSDTARGIQSMNLSKSGLECDYVPAIFDESVDNKSLRYQWFVDQTLKLIHSMGSVKTTSDQVLWEFYSDFFKKAVETGNANALARHIVYGGYPSEVLEWISGNTNEYQQMIDWLALQ